MTLIQTEPKKIYIRVDDGAPTATTLAWFPLVDDITDHIGTATITWWTQTKASIWYTFSCTNTGTSTTVNGWNFWSAWVKFNSTNNYYIGFLNNGAWFYLKHYESRLNNKFYIFTNSSFAADTSNNTWITTGTWYHICFGNDNWTRKFYINGSNFWSSTATNYFWNDSFWAFSSTDQNRTDTADISDIIVDSVCWTAQEIKDYYNANCSTYWLSPIN